jgi:aspartokinase/homoserine dehydrogenase 1
VEEFFKCLEKDDSRYIELKRKAKENNSIVIYTAKFEEGKAGLSLRMVDLSHPFSNLTNSENIVAFTTRNYWRNPLILRGQGAGADFTASGIITDILRVYNRNRG